ncbi:complex I NDUFA9 subunit family protein [Qipengyuania marisflavi]|uniref:Complex I NDUFA9 subunit family protein n=1 Tax=Qipengyuania marisflavi TaxID=2486356 RepID=A0A5S3P114_9SPHN|nr:complex I NDUFA9 subunit family protein [Qipengyuania marisflavi]TMM46563.1 complex I NDUFA9 subunit family protein [Qipengyuania marisflavi]
MAKNGALNGKMVVLMGGSGFLGNYVAQALLKRGARLRIASRHPEQAYRLKTLANLGQLQLVRCDATDRASVNNAIASADAVVNLVGSFDGNLARLMGEAPGWMAAAAKETGAQSFVHVSAIADPGDEDAPNAYGMAKQLGEERVRAAYPNAAILRPSVLFGRDDDFIQMFAGLVATFPVLPVFGPDAVLQPAYVDDVAEAIVTVLEQPDKHGGKTFELGGPEVLTMMQINQAIAAAQGRDRTLLAVPDALSGVFAMLPGTPMSSDQWRMLKAGNIISAAAPGFKQLGIAPKPLSLFLDKWMVRFRQHGRFGNKLNA